MRDVIFLGHKLSGLSIFPDPNKIAAVKEWPAPSSIKEVRQFLGFANYFRRFIDHYSMISRPLEEITGKHSRFEWNSARQSAFEKQRKALLSAPVLRLADVKKPFRVETDAAISPLLECSCSKANQEISGIQSLMLAGDCPPPSATTQPEKEKSSL